MDVKGKSLRSLGKVIKQAHGETTVKFAIACANDAQLEAAGFDNQPQDGDFLVPTPVGKDTSFNANGTVNVRKDLDKVTETRPQFRSWSDWHGNRHSGIQHRKVEVYPKEHIAAPEKTLTYTTINGQPYIVTDLLELNDEDFEQNLHIANMMLELFGAFEILSKDNAKVQAPQVRQLHWDIMPPGEYPWSKAKGLIAKTLENTSNSDRGVIESRLKFLSQYKPDFLASGRAGFSGYIVYGFSKKEIFVLESIYLNNATYVFGDDWEALSKLSKKAIIDGDLTHQRVTHNKLWNRKIRDILAK